MKNCEAADNIDREREGNPTRTHIRTSLSFCRRNQLQREQYLRVKLCRLRVGCALLERLSINRRMFCARTVQTPQSMKSAFRSLHQMIEAKGWNGPNYGEASAAAAPDGFVAVTGNCDPIGMAGLTLDGGHGERNRAPFHNLSLGELAFADGPGKMLRREASFKQDRKSVFVASAARIDAQVCAVSARRCMAATGFDAFNIVTGFRHATGLLMAKAVPGTQRRHPVTRQLLAASLRQSSNRG